MSLEQFVIAVRMLSSEGKFQDLVQITKISDVLVKNSQHLGNVLETLDIQQHSIGYLAVLCAKFQVYVSSKDAPTLDTFLPLFNQVSEFIYNCNGEQVRFAPEQYAELCHMLTESLIKLRCPIRGIGLLSHAIRKIQLSENQLTSIHADLCQLCLLSKCLKPALEFLDIDIAGISRETEAKYFLLFFYYGGMIYTALKNYERAYYFFEVCITTPASCVSHIMLEAYKKFILVSLILNGKININNLPRYTSGVVYRFIKHLSRPYQDLSVAYGTNNCSEVQEMITKYQDVFTRDNNLGLVKQVLSYLYKKNIQGLTSTFLTLSLTDVASRVNLPGPADAEKYILNMIEDGEIYATINQKDGMVIFHDDPEKYNSPRMLAKLEKEMAICAELGKRVLEMEEEVIVSQQYIRKACGLNDQDDQSATVPPANVPGAQVQHKHNTYSM